MNAASKKQQIRNVIAIFLAAFACAGFAAGYMIYRYGPAGDYLAANVLLSPYIIDQINYVDAHPINGNETRFVFNGIEFSYFDKLKGQQKQVRLNPQLYEQFYTMVGSERSLDHIPDKIESQFIQGSPATLILSMRTNSTTPSNTKKDFQVIQLIDDDYFRAQLRNEKKEGEWAYFYRAHLYQDAMRLFITPNSI